MTNMQAAKLLALLNDMIRVIRDAKTIKGHLTAPRENIELLERRLASLTRALNRSLTE